jgi:hypothetical protein
MIERIQKAGVRFDYVAADSLNGHDVAFCAGLDELGITFLTDKHKDTKNYLEDFKIETRKNFYSFQVMFTHCTIF